MPSVSATRGAEPVFAEPWEAQAFALVESLRRDGVFTAGEWTDALSVALDAQVPDAGGSDYYQCWLAALENLLIRRELIATDLLDATTAAWQRAAQATPHGQPILLENDPAR